MARTLSVRFGVVPVQPEQNILMSTLVSRPVTVGVKLALPLKSQFRPYVKGGVTFDGDEPPKERMSNREPTEQSQMAGGNGPAPPGR